MLSGEVGLKTQTFIGSSSEGLIVANAIKEHLAETTDCHVWTDGVFLPGRTYIETIETMLDTVDYAILVATPDDMLTKRDVSGFSMRDNVLLELGLFMAKLGRARTYLVSPQDKPILIPSDLLGVKTVSYVIPESASAAPAALAAPCDSIMRAMVVAEEELSIAMRRTLVKRLLTLTNRVQAAVLTFQSESVQSLMDRPHFEELQREYSGRILAISEGFMNDARRLGVGEHVDIVTQRVVSAVERLPFPDDVSVSENDVLGGILRHFGGERSIKDQLNDRVSKLIAPYEQWWSRHGPQISEALNAFQEELISRL